MFDLGKALAQLIFSPGRFNTLWDLLEDEDAANTHFQKWQYKTYDLVSEEVFTGPVSSLGEDQKSRVKQSYREEISTARLHYANMMLVTAYTYLEDNVATFFYEAFLAKPKLMIEFVVRDKGDSTIPLSLLIEEDKETILERMARETSPKASNGDIHKVCKRIKSVSGFDIPTQLQNKISVLQKRRNRIVHEATTIDLDREDVISSFDTVQELLVNLGKAANSMGVPVFDPAGLLDGE
ncbi:hypothetical protein ISD62_03540 [Pseudomonas aeruginosa]|nr:hypothetical protein [Pseudomonas aeruginosa]